MPIIALCRERGELVLTALFPIEVYLKECGLIIRNKSKKDVKLFHFITIFFERKCFLSTSVKREVVSLPFSV